MNTNHKNKKNFRNSIISEFGRLKDNPNENIFSEDLEEPLNLEFNNSKQEKFNLKRNFSKNSKMSKNSKHSKSSTSKSFIIHNDVTGKLNLPFFFGSHRLSGLSEFFNFSKYLGKRESVSSIKHQKTDATSSSVGNTDSLRPTPSFSNSVALNVQTVADIQVNIDNLNKDESESNFLTYNENI
ncbi:hypothetical protein HK099_003439, partial [Clydaea vesicula]